MEFSNIVDEYQEKIFDYLWNYENYKALNPLKTGEHSIMISTFLKI